MVRDTDKAPLKETARDTGRAPAKGTATTTVKVMATNKRFSPLFFPLPLRLRQGELFCLLFLTKFMAYAIFVIDICHKRVIIKKNLKGGLCLAQTEKMPLGLSVSSLSRLCPH